MQEIDIQKKLLESLYKVYATKQVYELNIPIDDDDKEYEGFNVDTEIMFLCKDYCNNIYIIYDILCDLYEKGLISMIKLDADGLEYAILLEIKITIDGIKYLKKQNENNNNLTNNFYLHGDASKININSIDNSIVNINNDDLFDNLIKEIQEKSQKDNEQIIEIIKLMKESKDDLSFKEHYNNFISKLADYIGIVSPFMPKITEILIQSMKNINL